MDLQIHEKFFDAQLAVGEFLGYSIKDDKKILKIFKRMKASFMFACLIFPFICGVHFICSNLRNIVNMSDTLAPFLNAIMCIVRHIMFMNNGDLIKQLINDLKSETRQGEYCVFT